MMRRRVSLLLVFVSILGLVGLPPASAEHGGKDLTGADHENSPRPPALPGFTDGECVVAGGLRIGNEDGNGGVASDQNDHNHYFFADVSFDCVSLSAQGSNYEGTYGVWAAGGTDGQGDCQPLVPGKDPQCFIDHGEQLNQGWSHSSCYAGTGCEFPNAVKSIDDLYDGTNDNPATPGQCYNCNEIEVMRDDGKASVSDDGVPGNDAGISENWLKFCRGVYRDNANDPTEDTCSNADTLSVGDKPYASKGGGNVIAWGALTDWTLNGQPNPDKAGEVVCFVADMELEPVGVSPNDPTKVINAILFGPVELWVRGDKADCAGAKKKT